MKLFFTRIITLLLFISSSGKILSQTRASFRTVVHSIPDNYDLETYRQSLWDKFPIPVGTINDFEGIFTNEEETKLDSIISTLERIKAVDIVIVTIDTIMVSQEKFNDFAIHLLDVWNVGGKVKDNGILICISAGYRQMRISNNFGIERIISDAETQQIINKKFIPSYRHSNYYQGTVNGLKAIISKIYNRLYLNGVQ